MTYSKNNPTPQPAIAKCLGRWAVLGRIHIRIPRFVGRHAVTNSAPLSQWPEPKIISVSRREGNVEIRLVDIDAPVVMKVAEFLQYPSFRVKVFEQTGKLFGPLRQETWEYILDIWQRGVR